MQPTKPTRPVPERLSKTSTCVNCESAPSRCVFEEVLLCDKCYSHVQFLLKKCKRELAATFDVYKHILRIAALEKKLFSLPKGIQDVKKSQTSPV